MEKSPFENLSFDTTLSVNDAIAQLGSAFGLDDNGVRNKIPEFKNFTGVVYIREVSGNQHIRVAGKGSGKAGEQFAYYLDEKGDVVKR